MDLYIVMYKPSGASIYYPAAVFDTLEHANRYVAANTGINPDQYYVDLVRYFKE